MNDAGTAGRNGGYSAVDALGAAVRPRTYRNVLYLVVAFPLWFLYGFALSFGLVFGLLTAVVGVGIAVLLGAVVGSRLLAGFERWLANALLGTDLRAPDDRPAARGVGSTVRSYLDAPSTWRGLGFLSLKFPVAIAGLVIFGVLWQAVELLSAPVRYPYEIDLGTVDDRPVTLAVETLPEAALAVSAGVVLALVALNLANGFAAACERMAAALLGDA